MSAFFSLELTRSRFMSCRELSRWFLELEVSYKKTMSQLDFLCFVRKSRIFCSFAPENSSILKKSLLEVHYIRIFNWTGRIFNLIFGVMRPANFVPIYVTSIVAKIKRNDRYLRDSRLACHCFIVLVLGSVCNSIFFWIENSL